MSRVSFSSVPVSFVACGSFPAVIGGFVTGSRLLSVFGGGGELLFMPVAVRVRGGSLLRS